MYSTIMIFSTLTALFALAGGLAGGLFGVIAAVAVALIVNFAFYLKAESIIFRIYQARPNDDYKLKGMLKKLAREAGIPVPGLYAVKTTHFMPNAFATGRNPRHAVVVITGSLLSLRDDEIEAVLAHEVAHIRNHDMLINMLAAAIGGTIAYLAQMGYWYLFLGGGGTRSGSHMLGTVLIMIFAPLPVFLIRMSIPRSMEYSADYTAVLFTKKPRALARALEKIQDSIKEKPLRGYAATSHLWTVNPILSDWFTKLFSRHPPTEERIKRLLELEGRPLE